MDKVTGIGVLKQALALPGVSRSSIGKALGIHASQVSRIAAGRFVKLEGHALRVCKYAHGLMAAPSARETNAVPALESKMARLVAANPSAARALSDLIEALLGDALAPPTLG